MATNSKGWTARLPVKIFCLLLIPALAFTACIGTVGIISAGYGDLGILLADIYANDYFYDAYVPDAFSLVRTVFMYQSESHIRGMGCLEWIEEEYSAWDEKTDGFIMKKAFRLIDKYGLRWGGSDWGAIDSPSIDPADPEAKRLADMAIDAQLSDFTQLKKTLAETNGLYYLFSDGDRILTNLAEERGADFFRSHPVYLIRENGSEILSRSKNGDRYSPKQFYYSRFGGERLTGYVAFSSDAVYAKKRRLGGGASKTRVRSFPHIGVRAHNTDFIADINGGRGQAPRRGGRQFQPVRQTLARLRLHGAGRVFDGGMRRLCGSGRHRHAI